MIGKKHTNLPTIEDWRGAKTIGETENWASSLVKADEMLTPVWSVEDF